MTNTITLREAAQQVLEAVCGAKLCEFNSMSSRHEMIRLMDEAINTLRAALAEPDDDSLTAAYMMGRYDAKKAEPQEPFGQVTVVRRPGCVDQHWFYRWPEPPYLDNAAECHVVYTAPQPRKRLTDQQILDIGEKAGAVEGQHMLPVTFARAIEAAVWGETG